MKKEKSNMHHKYKQKYELQKWALLVTSIILSGEFKKREKS